MGSSGLIHDRCWTLEAELRVDVEIKPLGPVGRSDELVQRLERRGGPYSRFALHVVVWK